MTLKKEWLVLIIIAAAIVSIIALAYFLAQNMGKNPLPLTGENKNITLPVATGNVDEATNAIIMEITDEDLVLEEEDNDISLLLNDEAEINDFGQSINEQDF